MYYALIHCDGAARPSLFDVAGRPLIARQLQWLRAHGFDRIAVEIDASPEALDLAEWLEHDELGVAVELVLTPRPAGPRAVARRLGWTGPYLAVPAPSLCSFDLAELEVHGALRVELPGGAWVQRLVGDDEPWRRSVPGVGRRILSRRDAHRAGVDAMTGALYDTDVPWRIPLHAAERSPGIWVARDAHVDAGAELVAPVLVGPRAFVAAGARLGPGVVVAADAVVERGAVVVQDHVAQAPRAPRAALAARLLALVLLLVLWPLPAARRALTEVAAGRRPVVGLRAERALISIDHALVPPSAAQNERTRAAAWYRANRSWRTDLHLLLHPGSATPEVA